MNPLNNNVHFNHAAELPSYFLHLKVKDAIDLDFSDTITTKGSKVYPKIIWKSDFQKSLYKEIGDFDRALQIYETYEKILLPILRQDSGQQKVVEDWIKDHAWILGNRNFNYLKKISKDLKGCDLLAKHGDVFAAFFRSISAFSTRISKKPATKLLRVANITTDGGGGHLMVAKAVQQYIQSQFGNNCESRIFSVYDYDKTADPYCVYTNGKMSTNQIYDEVIQKQNDPEKKKRKLDKEERIKKYIPGYNMQDMVREVADFAPDFILSTRHFVPDDLRLMYELDVPGAFIQCDFELNYNLIKKVHIMNHSWVKMLLPSQDKEARGPLSSFLKANMLNNEQPLSDEEMHVMKEKAEEIHDKLIDILGYPTREHIKPEKDEAVLHEIRQNWGVQEQEKVIMMAMGRQGVGKHMPELIRELISKNAQLKFADRIFVICGKNEQMKAEIESLLANNEEYKSNRNLQIIPLGYVKERQMAELYKITDLYIGKPGGATTAELALMGVKSLIIFPHAWEKSNLLYLQRHGLAEELQSLDHFITKLNEMLASTAPKESLKDANWQENLSRIIGYGIKAHQVKIKKMKRINILETLAPASSNIQSIAREHLKNIAEDKLHKDWNLKEFFPHIYILSLGYDREPWIKLSEADKKVVVYSKERLAHIIEHNKKWGLKESDVECFPGTFGRVEDELVMSLMQAFGLSKKKAESTAKTLPTRMNGNFKNLEPGEELTKQYKGQIGCLMSHYLIIKDASDKYDHACHKLWKINQKLITADETKKKKLLEKISHYENIAREYSAILILEDDNRWGRVVERLKDNPRLGTRIVEEYETEKLGKIFRKALMQLPPQDWDMLYFLSLGPFQMPSPEKPNLKKLTKGLCTAAYAINAKAYKPILKQLEKIKDPSAIIRPVDNELAILHTQMEAYVVHPALAYQGLGSTIQSNGENRNEELFLQFEQNDPNYPYF